MSAADLIEKRTASLPTAKLVRRPSFDEVCTLAAERTAELLVEAVASRGSGHLALTGGDVVAVHSSPKPPPERVSLTFDALHRSRCVMAVAGGAGKAEAVRAGLGAPDVVRAPASCARGRATTWYLDDAAASGLTG